MRSMTRWALAGCMVLAALATLGAVFHVAPATADATPSSTVSDPVGDTVFKNAPAFQDWVRGQMTKAASGDFELLLEMAAPVPADPLLPPPGVKEIWWVWVFDLDPTQSPRGYPFTAAGGRKPEFVVYVSWDGTEFAGTAIDRRPLLSGGEAIISPVPFSISGTIVEAVLPSALIGDVPASFVWAPLTFAWSGPVGSEGNHFVDDGEFGIFNP